MLKKNFGASKSHSEFKYWQQNVPKLSKVKVLIRQKNGIYECNISISYCEIIIAGVRRILML